MKHKTLNDFPEYVKVNGAVRRLQAERAEVSSRVDQIQFELSQPKQAQIDGEQAWNLALAGEDSGGYQTDNRSELRDELSQLEGRLRFIGEALEVGLQKLDQVVGQCSLEICQSVRPEWTAEIKVILECLKKISAANLTLDVMRADIERDGVVTGALPHSKFDLGGIWSDPYGGKVTGYQRYISENFPEVADAAGQSIKIKLKMLNERERSFNNQGAADASLQTQ